MGTNRPPLQGQNPYHQYQQITTATSAYQQTAQGSANLRFNNNHNLVPQAGTQQNFTRPRSYENFMSMTLPLPPRPPPPPGRVSFAPQESLAPPGTDRQAEQQLAPPSPAIGHVGGFYAPLIPPPLPPPFPYMSAELAHSLQSGATKCGKSFDDESSDLPFVPVIITDADLKKMTEKVKTQVEETQGKNLLLYEDIIDANLPKEVKEMFQPLYCKLCKITLSSPVVSRDHYKGKRHLKAVETWLHENHLIAAAHRASRGPPAPMNGIVKPVGQENARNIRDRDTYSEQRLGFDRRQGSSSLSQSQNQRHGSINNKRPANSSNHYSSGSSVPEFIPAYRAALAQPARKKPKPTVSGTTTSGGGPNFGFCSLCSVTLTSQVNSDQHYSGKNHKQRLLTARKGGEFGEDSRYGIGGSFSTKPSQYPPSSNEKSFNR